MLESLKALAATRGIASRAAFLGPKTQPDVVALMREADLFVLPAKRAPSGDQDGLPNVLMEAASQELPIVASDFAGIPEFIRDGQEGVLVQPGEWSALSNAINLMAREPERRRTYGMEARRRLVAEFGMDAGADWLARRFRAEPGGGHGVPAPREAADVP